MGGGGFPLDPPKVLTVPHLLACIAKLGAPGMSQAGGIPDLLLCPFLQVCWALCLWSARMGARGPYLSSAATQVGVRGHLPPPQDVFGPVWAVWGAQVLSPSLAGHGGLSGVPGSITCGQGDTVRGSARLESIHVPSPLRLQCGLNT